MGICEILLDKFCLIYPNQINNIFNCENEKKTVKINKAIMVLLNLPDLPFSDRTCL